MAGDARMEKQSQTDSSQLDASTAMQEDVNASRDQSAALAQNPNDSLESQGVLPKLDLEDPPPSSNSDASTDTQEWTIAVDLTVTQQTSDGESGAIQKQEELKKLAEQTKEAKVTLEVQYLVPNENGEGGTLKHYQIKDGQITEKPDTESKGMAQDLEDLVARASHDDPSEKIGLIVQSHGTAQDGISSGKGNSASLDEVDQAISNGLAGSGHEKLDFLDFDACLMGSTATLEKTKDLAENLVASAQLEGAMPGADGQDLNAALSELMKDPSMDGYELAEKFVDEAEKGSNNASTKGKPDGTSTLAHYDLSKVDDLNSSLNTLGNTLAELAQDPNNKAVLQQDIEESTRYGAVNDRFEVRDLQNRDLKEILNNIKQSLDSGELSDPSGKLAKDLEKAMAAEDSVSASNYTAPPDGSGDLDPNKIGDLSIVAPSQNFNDVNDAGERQNMLNLFGQGFTAESLNKVSSMDVVSRNQEKAKGMYEQLLATTDGANEEMLKTALDQQLNSLLAATSVDEYKKAARELDTALKSLNGTEVYDQFQEIAVEQARKTKEDVYQQAQKQETAGWNEFIRSLDA